MPAVKHITQIISRIPLAALTLMLAVACGQEKGDDRTHGGDDINVRPQKIRNSGDATPEPGEQPGGDDGAGDDGGDMPLDEGEVLKSLFTAVGLRNFEQVNATMSTVTGVPTTTAAVRTLFNDQLATSLPTDNDIKSFLGSHQVAIFKLAVQYCETLVANTTLRTNVFGTFNFAGTPAASLNAAGKAAVAEALITKFWGKDLETLPPHAESTQKVVALIDDLMVGKNANLATVTPVVVTGACTAVLAGAPVTMY